MNLQHDQWIEQALEVHSIISLKISSQFLLHGDVNEAKKKFLKEALILIDQLDFLLESIATQQATYQKTYHALFILLRSLGLDDWAIRALKRRFGTECFFIRQALQAFETLLGS